MKYYIATRLERYVDHNLVRNWMATRGHEITYDWTSHGSVKDQGADRIREVAEAETRGVVDADLVIVLLPGGRGTHAELGMAIARGRPVLLHSETGAEFAPGSATCAFYHHPQCRRVVGGLLEVMRVIRCRQPDCPNDADPGMLLCESCWDLANDAAGDQP